MEVCARHTDGTEAFLGEAILDALGEEGDGSRPAHWVTVRLLLRIENPPLLVGYNLLVILHSISALSLLVAFPLFNDPGTFHLIWPSEWTGQN